MICGLCSAVIKEQSFDLLFGLFMMILPFVDEIVNLCE